MVIAILVLACELIMVEIYKIVMKLAPNCIHEMFIMHDSAYNMRNLRGGGSFNTILSSFII